MYYQYNINILGHTQLFKYFGNTEQKQAVEFLESGARTFSPRSITYSYLNHLKANLIEVIS